MCDKTNKKSALVCSDSPGVSLPTEQRPKTTRSAESNFFYTLNTIPIVGERSEVMMSKTVAPHWERKYGLLFGDQLLASPVIYNKVEARCCCYRSKDRFVVVNIARAAKPLSVIFQMGARLKGIPSRVLSLALSHSQPRALCEPCTRPTGANGHTKRSLCGGAAASIWRMGRSLRSRRRLLITAYVVSLSIDLQCMHAAPPLDQTHQVTRQSPPATANNPNWSAPIERENKSPPDSYFYIPEPICVCWNPGPGMIFINQSGVKWIRSDAIRLRMVILFDACAPRHDGNAVNKCHKLISYRLPELSSLIYWFVWWIMWIEFDGSMG